jgi:PilZ domain
LFCCKQMSSFEQTGLRPSPHNERLSYGGLSLTPMTRAYPLESPGERHERRLKSRYALDLTVRFRASAPGSSVSGEGLAVNLSSGGVLVASRNQIAVGSLVEMSIAWPLLLDGRTPLQLIAVGRVLRRGARHFAATFERHEFRTMKSPTQA